MRGGLDDALDRLARRDKLRRRATGQPADTTAAVTELVEAVAAVVARNPELAITMGVEGPEDPILLTFAVDDGIVQISSDIPLTPQTSTAESPQAESQQAHFEPVIDADEIYPPDSYRTFAANASYAAKASYAASADTANYATAPVPSQNRRDTHRPPRQAPTPVPTPMPQVAEPEVTELAAKRLAAMLREDPSLLQPHPLD